MKNIRPASFDIADLVSNVPITETAWTAGTYTQGDQRYVGIDIYEVVAASTTDEPTAGAALETPSWILVGQINRWRMFNGALYQPTIRTGGPLEVTVTVDTLVNAVAVLKCDASTAVVTMTDATDGEVYNRTVQLVDNSNVQNAYDYFFAPLNRKREFVLLDLPPYAGADIEVTLDAGLSDTACGALVIGQQSRFGSTYLNFSLRDRFFSMRERNVFGDFLDVLSRPVAREASFDVLLNSTAVSQVLKLVSDRRDVPTVFIGGEDYEHSIVFGFPDEPETEQLSPDLARLKLTILGQT